MFIVISPAKKLNFDIPAPVHKSTQFKFKDEAEQLIKILRKCTKSEVSKLMKLSDSLTELNVKRYKDYKNDFDLTNSKQAVFAFSGDTYVGLDAESLKAVEVDYAQRHLGILSGLYGLLRPLDLIRPYRLEMGTKLKNDEGKNLYDFWAPRLTNEVNKILKKEKTLINLSSNEYFSALKRNDLKGEVVTPVFKEKKGDEYKVIGFCAKKARGMMSRFIIQNKISDVEGLKEFNSSGYKFNKKLSKENELVFTR